MLRPSLKFSSTTFCFFIFGGALQLYYSTAKEYTAYEATQGQRKLETKMRAERQSIKLLQDGGADESDLINARAKYRVTSSEYVDFSKAMGLLQQRERVLVDGLGGVGKGKWKQPLQNEGSSGIINTKFDIEKAKDGYSEFLNTVPKANRSILEYYANTTEYVSTDKIKSAFGYSPTTDKVYYNTKHPSFNDFDFSVVNTHELAHRIDNLNCKSWENKNFVNAVAKHNIVDKDMIAKVQSYVSSNKTSPFFDDVISALSENRVKVKARHENEYWKNKGAKETEIFANMFSLESYKATNEIEFISSNFSDIKLEYLKMRGGI